VSKKKISKNTSKTDAYRRSHEWLRGLARASHRASPQTVVPQPLDRLGDLFNGNQFAIHLL
jgi:hypothetical protein